MNIINPRIDSTGKSGTSFFIYAKSSGTASGYPFTVLADLSQGRFKEQEVKTLLRKDKEGKELIGLNSMFFQVAKNGSSKLMTKLIKAYDEVNTELGRSLVPRLNYESTPDHRRTLAIAVDMGSEETLNLLLNRFAKNISAKTYQHAIYVALWKSQPNKAISLLKHAELSQNMPNLNSPTACQSGTPRYKPLSMAYGLLQDAMKANKQTLARDAKELIDLLVKLGAKDEVNKESGFKPSDYFHNWQGEERSPDKISLHSI